MKHSFARKKPDCLIKKWRSKYGMFSWLAFGITAPNPIYFSSWRFFEKVEPQIISKAL